MGEFVIVFAVVLREYVTAPVDFCRPWDGIVPSGGDRQCEVVSIVVRWEREIMAEAWVKKLAWFGPRHKVWGALRL